MYKISLALKMILDYLTYPYCICINYALALQRQIIQTKLRSKYVV